MKEQPSQNDEELLKYKPGAGIRFTELSKKMGNETVEQTEENKTQESILDRQRRLKAEMTKEYLKREEREIEGPVIQEAIKKRDQLLDTRGLLQMSKGDFYAYFSSSAFEVRADLKQQNVKDCYLLAAIHAMSCSPHFEMMCRSSMKRRSDGVWEVRMPLLSENYQVVTITPAELLPQENKQFQKWSEKEGRERSQDLRRELEPVEGKEGLRVLEAAFVKKEFGSVDRLAADYGQADKALLLLGGDNFKRYTVNSQKYNEDNKKWEDLELSSLTEVEMVYLDHYLENFDPEIHIATAGTRSDVDSIPGFYSAKGSEKLFAPGHSYSISKINSESKIVTLADPMDTSEPIELTFDQFKKTFSSFQAVRIDSAKLLENIESFEKKASSESVEVSEGSSDEEDEDDNDNDKDKEDEEEEESRESEITDSDSTIAPPENLPMEKTEQPVEETKPKPPKPEEGKNKPVPVLKDAWRGFGDIWRGGSLPENITEAEIERYIDSVGRSQGEHSLSYQYARDVMKKFLERPVREVAEEHREECRALEEEQARLKEELVKAQQKQEGIFEEPREKEVAKKEKAVTDQEKIIAEEKEKMTWGKKFKEGVKRFFDKFKKEKIAEEQAEETEPKKSPEEIQEEIEQLKKERDEKIKQGGVIEQGKIEEEYRQKIATLEKSNGRSWFWGFLKERGKGLATLGLWEVGRATGFALKTGRVGRETKSQAELLKQEGGFMFETDEAWDEAIEINKKMPEEEKDWLENYGAETDRAKALAVKSLSAEISGRKRELNKQNEEAIVASALKKLEDKLKNKVWFHESLKAEYMKAHGGKMITPEQLAAVEQRLREEVGRIRKGQVNKDLVNFSKLYRQSLDKNWWMRYVYGTLGYKSIFFPPHFK